MADKLWLVAIMGWSSRGRHRGTHRDLLFPSIVIHIYVEMHTIINSFSTFPFDFD